MEFKNIIELIDKVSESNIDEFTYEENGASISLKKNEAKTVTISEAVKTPILPAFAKEEEGTAENIVSAQEVEGNAIKSPLVGTFYASMEEGGEPIVKVGDSVKAGQVIAIVEAMKLMNEIESDVDGVIKEITARNGEPVEYGQTLFVIS